MSLYLKYRPQDFNNLVGQHFINETLKKAIQENKTVGAYLLCGPRGT
jgi:DNA polymerase-3 subunit gamma/tau